MTTINDGLNFIQREIATRGCPECHGPMTAGISWGDFDKGGALITFQSPIEIKGYCGNCGEGGYYKPAALMLKGTWARSRPQPWLAEVD